MTIKLLHHLLDVSSYVYEELTDTMGDYDITKNFWKYLKSKFLDDNTKKIKVSDYIREELFRIDVKKFNARYSCKLQNIKKSKQQVAFICSCVALMFQHSAVGDNIIEWC